MAKQEITGKAFEYACVKSIYDKLSDKIKISLVDDKNFVNTKIAFEKLSETEQYEYLSAANKGIEIILPLEPNLEFPDIDETLFLSIQPDKKGQSGDVRDVLCVRNTKGWNIGLSCKHDHDAVKHSRLSRTIDFGKDWLGFPVSDDYKNKTASLFDELDVLKKKKARWSGLEKKDERFYLPLLNAFVDELNKLYNSHSSDVPENLLQYLLGTNDFYKVITHTKNKTIEVKPFNIYGTLGLATKIKKEQYKIPRLKLPTKIHNAQIKDGSTTTVEINCDNGWELSLRIHNASEWVEPSLKFDIQLVGVPKNLGTRIEPW